MNIWHVIANIGKAVNALRDLSARVLAFHSDPAIQAAIAANPALKADSDAISADVRAIQDSFR